MTMQVAEAVAVQFSGGRDSTLAVCEYVQRGHIVHALRFRTGLGVNGDLTDFRVKELQDLYGDRVLFPGPIPCYGLVREIATTGLEEDFRRYGGRNLILLGEKLAIHAYSVSYCRSLGVPTVADGVSAYQNEFPEQRACVVEAVRDWTRKYDIEYETPMAHVASMREAIVSLTRLGLSSKPLEGLSMFAYSASYADDDTCLAYTTEKLRIMSTFVDSGMQFKYLRTVMESNRYLGDS